MSRQRKRQFRIASIATLSLILVALAALVPTYLLAINNTEWETVRDSLDKYISSQYQAGAEGEAGFLMDQAALKARIDSNNDGIYLGEGDDIANAPVLVDVLSGNATWIPGTSVRGNWNTTSLQAPVVGQVAAKVNQHVAAGISTDVVVYCATGHTESVVAGGYGAIAQAGGLGGGSYPNAPKVLTFKWGRNGWQDTPKTYTNTNPTGAAGPTSTFADATQPDTTCNGKTGAELVRCVAERAVSAAGGNVSNGVNPPLGAVQPVDIRTPSPASTINNTGGGNPATIQIPVNTLFNTGLNKLDPAGPKKIFASRTQHLAGIVATGAEMLGYDSSFLQWGMPNWNNTLNEKWVSTGVSYPLTSTPIDTTAPSQTGVGHANVTQDHADIFRNSNEPATMKIEYGTSTMYGTTDNYTVLKSGTRTEHLYGLTPNTTYYYRVTSYDGYANASSSATGSFTTLPPPDTEPPVVTYTGPTGTINNNSPTVTGTATDNVGVTSAHLNLNGGPNISCTVTPSGGTSVSISCPTSGLADGNYNADIQAHDAAGNTGIASGNFTVDTADNEPPVATYTGPTGTVNTSSPTVTGTATDNVGVTAAHLNVDGGPNTSCTVTPAGGTSVGISCSTSGLADGPHTAVITAHDAAGNNGSASGSFTVDTADNEPPMATYTGPTGTIMDHNPTVTGTATDNVGVTSAHLNLDGGPDTSCTVTPSGGTSVSIGCPTSGLADGPHTAVITAHDAAGNTGSASGSFTVESDTAPPVVTYTGPTGTITDHNPTVTGTATDNVAVEIVSLSLNGGPSSPCSIDGSGNVSCPTSGLADGPYTAVITATDAAGNSGSASGSFTVETPPDTTPPHVENVQPTGTITDDSPTIIVEYHDHESGINVDSVIVNLDGAPLSGCTVTGESASCPTSGLALGEHHIEGSVADNAGNVADFHEHFTIEEPGAGEDQYGVECPGCGPIDPELIDQFGLGSDLLYIANGRASNVAVIDVAMMEIVDYLPVPRAITNVLAPVGQTYALVQQVLRGLNATELPYTVHDMFYWEIHGVVPSADRKSVYAQGALSFTPADNTLYQVDVKTRGVMREIQMTKLPSPAMVGYCGIEYDRNDESSGVIWSANMQTGPEDLMALGGSSLKLHDALDGLLPALGLGGLLNSVENQLPQAFGGLQEVSLASGAPGRFIATDYNGNLNSSTCGVAWNKAGTVAYASQMFEPLIDTINWNTKQLTGDILPPAAFTPQTMHQSTSAKNRGLMFTAWGPKGVAVTDMNLNAIVGGFSIAAMGAHGMNVHGVEISPSNENILYVTGDGMPWGGTYVIDITDLNAPVMIGGLEMGIDIAACGTYAISDKETFYAARGVPAPMSNGGGTAGTGLSLPGIGGLLGGGGGLPLVGNLLGGGLPVVGDLLGGGGGLPVVGDILGGGGLPVVGDLLGGGGGLPLVGDLLGGGLLGLLLGLLPL